MTIENAKKEDADMIASAILSAIGEELTNQLAGDTHTPADVHALFSRLAARDDTQYSYINTRIARDNDGNVMGVAISYDGEDLIKMRREFFHEANRSLGWNISLEDMDALPGETDSEEFYLDTLSTFPQYRKQGIGRQLILDAKKKADKTGKPLGLLCEPDNHLARRLYDSAGFKLIGQRPFAGHLMNHMILSSC